MRYMKKVNDMSTRERVKYHNTEKNLIGRLSKTVLEN